MSHFFSFGSFSAHRSALIFVLIFFSYIFCFVLPHFIISHLIFPLFFWSCPVSSHLVSSPLLLFSLIFSLLFSSNLFTFILVYLVLSHLTSFGLLSLFYWLFSSRLIFFLFKNKTFFRHITHKRVVLLQGGRDAVVAPGVVYFLCVWAHPLWKNPFFSSVFCESCQKCFHCCQLILSDSWQVLEILSAHMPALRKGVFGVISEICVSWFITKQWWLLFQILVLGKTWN